jgi:hypothetical protein
MCVSLLLPHQTNQIRELFARDEMSASKAELHAAMAGLTFKNRAESTSDILGNAIQKIFEGNRNSHNSKQQTKDIQSFLSNPYEAIAVICKWLFIHHVQNILFCPCFLIDIYFPPTLF